MAAAGDPPASIRKPKGQPWSHEETLALIDSYEAKWYALKRGQLRAQQWEEVAAAAAARCGLADPSKTGTQCRHKIEKLRKRFRSERQRPFPSPWPFFDRMARMERGPLPVSARPPTGSPVDSDDHDEFDANTRSINGILREENAGFRNLQKRRDLDDKRRVFDYDGEEDDEEEEEKEEEEGGGGAMSELAAAVRRFGDGMVRMEKRRMEMMREVERDWMEMETRRAKMVLESERCLVEMIVGVSSSSPPSIKKPKKSQDT